MKKLNWKLPLLLLLICVGFKGEAVKVEPVIEQMKTNNINITSRDRVNSSALSTKDTKKIARKKKRVQRKMERLQRKIAKWSKQSKRFFGGATDNAKFRLGLLCLIGGLGFVILVNIIGLGWLFGGLGGLLALVGICLMIWGVLEYTN